MLWLFSIRKIVQLAEILRDNTIINKLMYIPNDDIQKKNTSYVDTHYCLIGLDTMEPTNQNSIKVPKFLS